MPTGPLSFQIQLHMYQASPCHCLQGGSHRALLLRHSESPKTHTFRGTTILQIIIGSLLHACVLTITNLLIQPELYAPCFMD